MSEIKEELEKRFQRKREDKSSSWASFIKKIILLIAVLLLIKFFGSSEIKKMNSLFQGGSEDSVRIKNR